MPPILNEEAFLLPPEVGARTKPHPQPEAPFIRASAITPLVQRFEESGHQMGLLLWRHGMTSTQLRDPYAVVSLYRYASLLEDMASASKDPFFGARAGSSFKPGDIGPIGILFSFSATIRSGFQRLSTYITSLQSATSAGLAVDADTLTWSYRITGEGIWPRRQDAEYTIATCCQLVRSFFRPGWRPLEIHFEHEAPRDARLLSGLLGNAIHFNQSSNRIVMSLEDVDRAYRTEDPVLTGILQRHVRDLMVDNTGSESCSKKVRGVIDLYMGRRSITIAMVAAELSLSPRTVQRRLEKEGSSLRSLIREHRESLACRQLADSDARMSSLAQALGYADGSVFCRAFKTWKGMPPTKSRQVLP